MVSYDDVKSSVKLRVEVPPPPYACVPPHPPPKDFLHSVDSLSWSLLSNGAIYQHQ